MLPNRFSPVNAVSMTNPTVTSILLFILFSAASYAGTWRDSFEDGILNGWQPGIDRLGELVGYKVHWTTGDDRLNVQVLDIPRPLLAPSPLFKPAPGPSRLSKFALAFLEFTAFRLEEEHLVAEGVGMVREGFMTFGIAIGQHYPPSDRRTGIVYLFGSRGCIYKVSFSGSGSFGGRKTAEIDYVNPKSTESGYLKVVFNAGHFQVYSGDGLKATLVDPEYETVDLVGLMIWGEVPGSGSLDEFVISGPCIPNGTGNVSDRPADKLVTTWACIKRRSRSF